MENIKIIEQILKGNHLNEIEIKRAKEIINLLNLEIKKR